MRRNVASQVVGAQMVSATDGSAFTGAVTCYVTVDGGTQAAGGTGSGACTHEGNGFHTYVPTQGETNGAHVAFTFTGTGAVPVTVQVYPTVYGSTGIAEANLTQISGSAVSASTAQLGVNVVNFGGSAGTFASGIPSVALTTNAINAVADQVWDESASGHVAAGSFGAVNAVIRSGTAQAGASTTITLDASASAVDDFYNNQRIVIVSGTGAGQGRIISDYVGSTKVATVSSWATNPDSTSVFVILPFGSIPGATAPTAGEVADAVWDELLSGHLTSGSAGQALSSGVLATGTAQAGAATTITLAAGASATNDLYNYCTLSIISGTGAGQSRQITDYVGSTKIATVGLAWATNPSSDSVYVITPLGVDAATVASIADAVWDEARSGHVAAGSFGEYVLADVTRISGDATAADNLESATDGTGYAFTNCTIPTVTAVTNTVNANVTQISGDSTAADNLEAAADGTGYNLGGGSIVAASVTGAVGSVTGNVGGNVAGNVVGSVGSVTGAVGSVTGNVGGNVVGSVASVTNTVNANVTQISGDSVAADNLESYCDGTDRIGVDVKEINSVVVTGTGTAGNEWGP